MKMHDKRTDPKIYEEKCDVKFLILLTKSQSKKSKKLSEKLGLPMSQIFRNFLDMQCNMRGITEEDEVK